MPKVSIIIPNYNHAEYLTQRIDSVLNQTYTDFEVILLDDCSTDNSRQVIEQYRNDARISHIVYNETNSGNTFRQWDKGIQLAKGEYIWIAESDDWCEITLLENLVAGTEQNKNCVLAYCQSFCVTENDAIKFQSLHTKLAEYVDGKKFIQQFMLLNNPIFNAGMAIWKKEVYYKMSRDYVGYKMVGDYFFWIEVCTFGDVFICGKLLNYFRAHERNVSFKTYKNGLTYTEQIPMLKQLLDKNIINHKDYLKALKKAYSLFRFSEKKMPKENVATVKKLFSSYSKANSELKFYFYQKYVQFISRKLLRL